MNPFLKISPEVAEALLQNKPIVALESTIISHGMPYPKNVETALAVEQVVRDNGAVPATIAIINEHRTERNGNRLPFAPRSAFGVPRCPIGSLLRFLRAADQAVEAVQVDQLAADRDPQGRHVALPRSHAAEADAAHLVGRSLAPANPLGRIVRLRK